MLLDYISISQVKCKTSGRKVLDWKVVYYVEESEYSRIEKIDKRFKKSFKLLGLSIKSHLLPFIIVTNSNCLIDYGVVCHP